MKDSEDSRQPALKSPSAIREGNALTVKYATTAGLVSVFETPEDVFMGLGWWRHMKQSSTPSHKWVDYSP